MGIMKDLFRHSDKVVAVITRPNSLPLFRDPAQRANFKGEYQMAVLENIPIQVDFQGLLSAIGGDRKIPGIRAEAQWACETVEQLAKPKAIVGIFQIDRLETDTITIISEDISEPVKLEIGKKGVGLLEGASCVQVSFVTLGMKMQSQNEDLQKQNKMLKQYLLDTASILALYHVGQLVNQHAENIAAEKNWGVSRRLSPGDLRAWALSDQCVLGKLLPVEQIDIEIKTSGLLYPLKSASSLIGIGPGLTDGRVGTICQWCSNQKTCPIKLSKLDE
jgi:hypothetical protein